MEQINSAYAHKRPYNLAVYEDLHRRFREFLTTTKQKADTLERERVELEIQARKSQGESYQGSQTQSDRLALKGMELKQKETDLKREYVDKLEAFIDEFRVSESELQELRESTARKILSQWFYSATAEQHLLETKAMNFTAIYRDASPEVLKTTALVDIQRYQSLSLEDKGFLYWMETYCTKEKTPPEFNEWREMVVTDSGDTAFKRINNLAMRYRNLNFAFALGKSMASLDPSQADLGKFWEPTNVEGRFLDYLK